MTTFFDYFSDISKHYAATRPTYPRELFEFIASIAPGVDRVWDCATGNGQAAVGLKDFFRRVEATDASERQISNAVPREGVRYSVRPAEHTDFDSESFDAVCVAQALHWLDHERFFPEVRRVLKPEGVFVACAYNWFTVSEEIDREFKRSVRDVVRPYWPKQVESAWNEYRDVPIPFERIESPTFPMALGWTQAQLMAFVRSWSGTQRCVEVLGDGFLTEAEQRLAELWGDAEKTMTVRIDVFTVAARKQGGD